MRIFFTILFTFIINASYASSTVWRNCGNSGYYKPLVTNWYADASAGGTHVGTLANPFATIAQINSAMGSFSAGDIIHFKKGETFTGGLNITCDGAVGDSIYFISDASYGTGAQAKITRGSAGGSQEGYVINVGSGKSYIVIDGIDITDVDMDASDHAAQANVYYGIYFDGGDHCTARNLTVEMMGYGIAFYGDNNTADNVTVTNSRMIRNTDGSLTPGDPSDDDDDYGAGGVVVANGGTTVKHSFFISCWGDSHDYGKDGGAFELFGDFSNCVFDYNYSYDNIGFMEVGSSTHGTMSNIRFAYNKVLDSESFLLMPASSGSFAVTAVNFEVYNNTVVQNATPHTSNTALLLARDALTSGALIFKNNILWASNGHDIAEFGKYNTGVGFDHQYNLYYVLGGGSVVNFTLHGTESSSPGTIFTSTSGAANTWDLHLIASSTAENFGTNLSLTLDYDGVSVSNPPEAGAYEIVSVVVGSGRDYFSSKRKHRNR